MPVETTYTSLRERLASVLDQVANDQEVVIVRRRGAKDVALIPAEELASLMETAHLLRSPWPPLLGMRTGFRPGIVMVSRQPDMGLGPSH